MLVKYKTLPWPLNFWSAVFQNEVQQEDLPPDWELVVDYILARITSYRRSEIILSYFRDGMTLREIGAHHGISAENIRQHADKTVRKIRQSSLKLYMLLGMDEGTAAVAAHRAKKNQPVLPDESSIDSLGLTPRAWNCLRRAGIETIQQLTQHSSQSLLKYRNMGVATVRTIENCLAARGLSLQSGPDASN